MPTRSSTGRPATASGPPSASAMRCSATTARPARRAGRIPGTSSIRLDDLEAGSTPGLKAADQVRGVGVPQPMERRRDEARLVALVTEHDQPAADHFWVAPLRGGIAAPLEHVARDEPRA